MEFNLTMITDIGMRDFHAFSTLANMHSYTIAAEALGMTQSALSKRIKGLEEKLKVRLFDRTTRNVALTPEGQEFLQHAAKMLDQFERSVKDIRERASGNRGRLTIAAAPHMSANILPPVIAAFSARHPEVEIQFHDCRSHEIIKYVLSEEVDIGVTVTPWRHIGHPQIVFHPVVERPEFLVVAYCRGHPLETVEQITWESLKPFRVIHLRATSAAVRLVDSFRNETNMAYETMMEVSLIDTALGMAAAGVGIVILPQYVTSKRWNETLAYRAINNTSMRVTYGLQHLRGRTLSGPPKIFAKHLQAHLIAINKIYLAQ